ncbi:N,N-dimethylformamidase beta subunit family domain-containing protein [Lihuaxuella thermophila]|uniref:N,N-dimethylformamidase beta subunit-like C-terminal domain-containing protein n=1 Tax=Lihuaxuella thermophila TaxID=1173111 RepID=A0A1H8G5I5_9BACL|nr:N,N-dimethylformamidase beta subunit family domain-containing protein [Lihuaxuella thermophila]SEN38558.1 hypothetical protein SAMN05444955_11050 [Lihuaxuella thermophila]
MDKFDVLRKIEEKFGKEVTRREFLSKISQVTGLVVGSAILTPEVVKLVEKYLTGTTPSLKSSAIGHAEGQNAGTKLWKITKPGYPHLQGYASELSVEQGAPITFFVHSVRPYRMEIYRMGYYGGLGARLMETVTGLKAMRQNLIPNPETMECSWEPSHVFHIPSHWPSGFYLNKLVDENGKESYIPFIVRETLPTADFAVLCATNTYHAYKNWGGRSLYSYNSKFGQQAMKVSFNRPFRDYYGAGLFFQFEYNLIRWLEKEGYSLTFISDMDLHNGILEKSRIKALLIAGHSEYWSMEMRKSVEKWSASEINLAVFSANVAYWQVRMQPDDAGRPNRLMVSYKQFAREKDPYRLKDKHLVTGRWRDQPVNMPEDQILGIMYSGIPEAPAPLVVSNLGHWLYEGTGLKRGDRIPGVVGGEVDTYRGKLPGVEVIAHSPVMLYGKPNYADVAWYNKPGGGKVFSVGTFYWNWFLDSTHYTNRAKENQAIQQITRNALLELKK